MPDQPAPGFDRPTTTPVPDDLFDRWLPHLSEAELKVLLYIIRRTLGFKKDADAISLSQLAAGIVRRDGRRLDSGAGVSEKSCRRGIAGLLAKGLITQTKTKLPDGGDGTTIYSLCWRGETSDHRGLVNLSDAGWSEQPPQETDVTTNKNGSDVNRRAFFDSQIRALCRERRWPPPGRADLDTLYATGYDALIVGNTARLRCLGSLAALRAEFQPGGGGPVGIGV